MYHSYDNIISDMSYTKMNTVESLNSDSNSYAIGVSGIGTAFSFDGTDQYLNSFDRSDTGFTGSLIKQYNFSKKNLTFSVWVKRSTINSS